jgi:hypothetical protein
MDCLCASRLGGGVRSEDRGGPILQARPREAAGEELMGSKEKRARTGGCS